MLQGKGHAAGHGPCCVTLRGKRLMSKRNGQQATHWWTWAADHGSTLAWLLHLQLAPSVGAIEGKRPGLDIQALATVV